MDSDPGNKQKQNINMVPSIRPIFQSFWIRYNTILASILDRKFVESQLRYVLYCGTILWTIYLLSTIR